MHYESRAIIFSDQDGSSSTDSPQLQTLIYLTAPWRKYLRRGPSYRTFGPTNPPNLVARIRREHAADSARALQYHGQRAAIHTSELTYSMRTGDACLAHNLAFGEHPVYRFRRTLCLSHG